MTKLTITMAVLGTLTFGMAAQTTAQVNQSGNNAQVSVKAQIEAIQNAPQQERVQLMNQLKERLSTMSPQERQEVMQELHLQMRAENGNEHADDQEAMQRVRTMRQEQTRQQEHERDHAQEMQEHANEAMQRQQELSQREAGEQYRHEHGGEMPHTESPMEMENNFQH